MNKKTPPYKLGYREIMRFVRIHTGKGIKLEQDEQLIKMKVVQEDRIITPNQDEHAFVVLHIRKFDGVDQYGNKKEARELGF